MYVLLPHEKAELVKAVENLDTWIGERLDVDPEDPLFLLVPYAEGLRDGMQYVLVKMGVKVS